MYDNDSPKNIGILMWQDQMSWIGQLSSKMRSENGSVWLLYFYSSESKNKFQNWGIECVIQEWSQKFSKYTCFILAIKYLQLELTSLTWIDQFSDPQLFWRHWLTCLYFM